MKSIEFIAYAVREYDVKYSIVLDDTDPFIQEMLLNNNLTFDDLANLDFADYQGLWDTLMTLEDTKLEEDFAPAEERYIDFATYISESA